ncbi:MAG: DMT family transporter [Brevirhabdus sp.]
MHPPDRPLLGIALMFGFCVLAPMGDSVAKLLGGYLPVGQLVTLRFAVQMVLLVPLVLFTGGSLRMSARVVRLTAMRTVLHILGIGAMFMALQHLPLADAVAIAFVMPFIMLLLGRYVLGEEVGWRRLVACLVGFVGTLMVMQPSFVEVGWPALLPVFVAVVFALFMLVTRQIARDCDPVALQAVSGAMALVILVPLIALGAETGIAALDPVWPSAREWGLLVALGMFGTMAHLLMTWSLRFAPSTTLAPMQYLEIPIATFFGWLIFHEFPDGLALAGIVVVILSGLYVVFRERAMARIAPAQP